MAEENKADGNIGRPEMIETPYATMGLVRTNSAIAVLPPFACDKNMLIFP
jgi:hypothetical protein